MNTAKYTMTTAAAMVLALGLWSPVRAQATEEDGYGDGYQSGAYGRVRSADAGATIVRADSERDEPDAASVNAPLFPGDVLRTDDDQRVEVQLARGSTIRIDNSGEVLFQSLPNPAAEFQDNTVLALKAGVIRITSRLGEKEEFRIDTRDASVYLLGEGEFRIATDDRGGTRVLSLRGVAEVVGNEASVLVRGGMGTSVVAGSTPDSPRAYSALASDGFDRWCASRDDAYRVHDRYAAQGDEPRDVPDEVRPYYGELSTQGRFDVDPDYGTVWYPTGVASDWRPYNDGYWSYGPGGYFWVSNEPWGWAPYHYGNWQWTSRHRWCWVPGRVFAGAWVSWSWGSLNVGWAPLDCWGRPGWTGGSLYGGFYDSRSWTFVGYNRIHSRNVGRYAVPIDRIRDDLRHATVVARAPRVDPRRIAASQRARESALNEVVRDRAARMSPIQTDRRPERRLSEVQNHLMRRPQQASPVERARRSTIGAPGIEPRQMAPRPRRIFEDPRSGSRPAVRPETRDDVRDLYQRMSRPRETRGQEAATPRADAPSYHAQPRRESPGASRRDDPRVQPRRESPGASRRDDPRVQPRRENPGASRQEAPRFQPRREAPSASRQEAPRFQPRREAPGASRQEAPRFQPRREAPSASRREAPRAQPRVEAPRSQAPRERAPRTESPRPQASPRAKEKHGDRH